MALYARLSVARVEFVRVRNVGNEVSAVLLPALLDGLDRNAALARQVSTWQSIRQVNCESCQAVGCGSRLNVAQIVVPTPTLAELKSMHLRQKTRVCETIDFNNSLDKDRLRGNPESFLLDTYPIA